MVRAARQVLRGDPRFTFSVAEAAHLPAGDGTQDALLAHHMLYHVPDRAAALWEFHRVLRPGGLLSIALNGRAHMREIVQIARETPGVRVVGDAESLGSFDMEDAPPEIGAIFEDVEVRRYTDALAITEARPVVDYLASDFRFTVDDREAAERALVERIARDSSIRIGKSSGLIFARKKSAARIR
jgi:ubiquinone/menaquinone biosynthesis C-methylase UbiE